jgi:damage-control phosphatase, subfamily I
MNHDCLYCLSRMVEKMLKSYDFSADIKLDLTQNMMRLLSSASPDTVMPEVTANFFEYFKTKTGLIDPFLDAKRNANSTLLGMYDQFKEMVFKSENKFETALKLSIAGNIIDLGLDHEFEVQQTIRDVLNSNFDVDHSVVLEEKIANAKQILYLGDNCGEIVFDKLFLETINHPNIYFAVRGKPILNDATLSDAYSVGIDHYAKVISNNYGAPSTILHKAGHEFNTIFNNSDIIISKGMGNFEGLSHLHDDRIFFLLMVKCEVVARQLNVKKGGYIAMQNIF